MFVPSYVPPPIEIPDNVADATYLVRLGFIRRVLHYFGISIAFAFGASLFPIIFISAATPTIVAFGILALLSVVRNIAKGRRMEVVISTGLLLPMLIALGFSLRMFQLAGWPCWPFLASFVFVWLYAVLCGRDLSFMGMFVLPMTSSLLVWIGADLFNLGGNWSWWFGALINAIVLLYFVYDLAALLTRRRLGEETGAVCDLFRDWLNFTTYWLQVYWHWRKYPLWHR